MFRVKCIEIQSRKKKKEKKKRHNLFAESKDMFVHTKIMSFMYHINP